MSAAALLFIGLLSACGGSSGSGAAASATAPTSAGSPSASAAPASSDSTSVVDPCTLLTPADISAAVGSTYRAGVAGSADPPIAYRTCSFDPADGSSGHGVTVEVLADADLSDDFRSAGKTTESIFVSSRQLVASAGGTDLSGVGDKAFVSPRKAAVLRHGVLVVVVAGLTGHDASGPLTALITTAAGRL